MTKGVDERNDEGVLRSFGHAERMEKDTITKSMLESVLVVVQWVSRGRDGLIP